MSSGDEPVIGVVGASGAVGRAAARALHEMGSGRLILGARRPGPLAALAAELGGDPDASGGGPEGAGGTGGPTGGPDALGTPGGLGGQGGSDNIDAPGGAGGPSGPGALGGPGGHGASDGGTVGPDGGPGPVPVATATVDADSEQSLAEFCRRCDVVLNCAGPSYRIVDRVALAALAAGADYVDVTGDSPVHERLAGTPEAEGRRVLLSAGVLPGLSALLPRWFARRHGLREITAHAGGLEHCTEAAAGDLLLSLPGSDEPGAVFGRALAAWHHGGVVEGALRTREGVRVPHFPGTVFVQPFLTEEARRLAADLGATRLEWYNVHPGEHTRAVLTSLVGRGADDPGAADRLRRAADLDLAGNTPYYQIVYSLTDAAGQEHTLLTRFGDSYRATGRAGAVATDAVVRGAVPTGVHHTADVLDPEAAVAALYDGDGNASLHLWAGSASAEAEEGAL